MNEETRLEIARRLREAELNRETFPAFSTDYPDMNQDDAYDIQLKMMQYRFDAGEKLAGVKIGLTSVGMQRLVNVDTPDYGLLTDKMLILEGQPCPADELIQPKVEGEFAFILKEDLDKEYVTVADVFNATSYIAPAIEIVDSRITDWKIHYYDTVSDNGSSARFVVGGGMMKPEDVDMRTTGMTIEKNGALVSSGASAEVFGNPAASVAWLANSVRKYGIILRAGYIILSGAFTAAVAAEKGDDFKISFGGGLGSVGVRFE